MWASAVRKLSERNGGYFCPLLVPLFPDCKRQLVFSLLTKDRWLIFHSLFCKQDVVILWQPLAVVHLVSSEWVSAEPLLTLVWALELVTVGWARSCLAGLYTPVWEIKNDQRNRWRKSGRVRAWSGTSEVNVVLRRSSRVGGQKELAMQTVVTISTMT